MSTDTLQQYVRKMECLQIDKAHGDAPHKPLLLLAVIELIEQGQICENRIYFSPTLAETVMKYWVEVTDRRFNIAMPFFHLKNDGKGKNDRFWFLHSIPGREKTLEKILESGKKIRTISDIHKVIAYASLKDDLFFLLTNPQHREIIRQTIIDRYFPDLKNEIKDLILQQKQITEQQIRDYEQLLISEVDRPFTPLEPIVSTPPDTPTRSAGFRKAIMGLYDYTCVVCRLRIVTMNRESATDAAHIIPFSVSQNDDVRNGVSLCKLHHWAFDMGLISLNETYQVVVSQLTEEQGPMEWMLTELRDKPILLPECNQFCPAQDALDWHREKVLRR